MTRNSVRILVASGVTLIVAAIAGTPAAAATPYSQRKPWPITLTVQTIPAMPGIRFALDGTTLATDRNGRATFTERHNFQQHTLTLLDPTVSAPDRRYRFARWAGQRDPGQAFRTTVTGLPMRANYTVTAAFTVQYPVSARFVDQSGRDLDRARITSATIRGDDGNILDLPVSRSIWLDGQVPAFNKSTLQLRQVSYSLQTVMVDGTNVVDGGRQRFQPAAVLNPAFVTQFHDLTIRSHDALFGSTTGTAVKITYPDGAVHTVAFDATHTATLTNLPRGQYSVDLVNAGGIALAQRLRLSRASIVDIRVVSHADQAVVVLALVLLAFGLLLVGRAHLRRAAAHQARAVLARLKVRRGKEAMSA